MITEIAQIEVKPGLEAEFEAAVKADPHAPNVNFGLGYLYWKLRRYEQAAPAFENEIAVDPQNAQALAYLGDVELKRENPDKALALLTRAIAIRQDIRIAQLDLGVLLTQQKKYPEALAALRRAEQLDPEQPEVHFRLGRLYQAMGDAASWLDPITGRHRRFEHWTSAGDQAVVVAKNLAGDGDLVHTLTEVPYFWSDQYDVKLQSLGTPAPTDDVELLTVGPRNRLLAVYGCEGRLTGVVGFGVTASHVASNPPPASKVFNVDFVITLSSILAPLRRPANLC